MFLIVAVTKYFLAGKKRGFGEGKWDGFGGKLESEDNSMEACALRELEEECGIKGRNLAYNGRLKVIMLNCQHVLNVHIYVTSEYENIPVETAEMYPQWFEESEIPYDKMWKDTLLWLPLVLQGRIIEGRYGTFVLSE